MMRCVPLVLMLLAGSAHAGPIHCEDLATADLQIDGLLDDWPGAVAAHVGATGGAYALRCAWDGKALAVSLDVEDDRVVRVTGRGHEDHVELSVSAGGKPAKIDVFPGNAIAKPRRSAPAHASVADSLQPRGFSIEARIPASAIPSWSASSGSLELSVIFHDSDQAAGGADSDVAFSGTVELSKVLEDFLRTVKLKKGDLVLDTQVALDPDRWGKQRLVAGGRAIGVLTDQFAYVTVQGDLRDVKVLTLGRKQIVSAVVHFAAHDVLMLWAVWSGQLSQLVQIDVRIETAGRVVSSAWQVVGKELVVTPKPAIGWTAETFPDQPIDDADPMVLPWDKTKKGVAYSVTGAEIKRRDLKR